MSSQYGGLDLSKLILILVVISAIVMVAGVAAGNTLVAASGLVLMLGLIGLYSWAKVIYVREREAISRGAKIVDDFSLTSVPKEWKRPWYDVAMVWIGVAIVLSALMRGALVGSKLASLNELVIAYIIGEAILIGIMILTGYIGAVYGLPTSLVMRAPFGKYGSWIYSIIVGFSAVGWYAIQAGLFGKSIYEAFKIPLGPEGWEYWAVIGGLLMMITAIIGYRALSILSWFANPALLVAALLALALVWKPEALSATRAPEISISTAATMIAGGFIVGVTLAPDVNRYMKPSFRDAILVAVTAMGVSACVQIIGALAAMMTNSWNVAYILITAAGLSWLGLFVLLAAQWTTNDNNLYSAALALNNMVQWKKKYLTIILGVIGSLLGMGLIKYFGLWLKFLGTMIPPFAGIMIADFYITGKRSLRAYEEASKTPFNWKGFTAWLVGSIVGYLTGFIYITPIPATINSLLSSLVVYAALTYNERSRWLSLST